MVLSKFAAMVAIAFVSGTTSTAAKTTAFAMTTASIPLTTEVVSTNIMTVATTTLLLFLLRQSCLTLACELS